MSLSGEVNGELRRRFEAFNQHGAPGQYITLPHGFKAEIAPEGDIVLVHQSCPSYPLSIGHTEVGPYRWVLGLNWERAAGTLVKMLGLEVEPTKEEIAW